MNKYLLALGGFSLVVVYLVMQNNNHASVDLIEPPSAGEVNTVANDEAGVIAEWYEPLTSFTFGRISMQASIADTDEERARGLSGTPYIPIGIAKVFIFDSSSSWSFWMKDMNYAIDIFWIDETGRVVHMVEVVTPDTYPANSFSSPLPAKYVIETKAGFAKENNIGLGAIVNIRAFERLKKVSD